MTTFTPENFEVRDHAMAGWGVYYDQKLVALVNPANGQTAPAPGAAPQDWISVYESILELAIERGFPWTDPERDTTERVRLVASFIQNCITSKLPAYAWILSLEEAGLGTEVKRAILRGQAYPLQIGSRFIVLHLGPIPAAKAEQLSDEQLVKASRGTPSGGFSLTLDLQSPGDYLPRRLDSGQPMAWRDLLPHLPKGHFPHLRSLAFRLAAERSPAWAEFIQDHQLPETHIVFTDSKH